MIRQVQAIIGVLLTLFNQLIVSGRNGIHSFFFYKKLGYEKLYKGPKIKKLLGLHAIF